MAFVLEGLAFLVGLEVQEPVGLVFLSLLDNVLHHAIPPDGPGLREVTYGSQKLVVENTCFYAGNRARIDDERDVKRGLCKYPGSWRDYLEKLGIVGRDTAKHPWGE